MNNLENANSPVTWEMLAEKLDAELKDLQTFTPPHGTEHLLPYFKAAATYIHRHLKDHRVPHELYDTIYRHNKILGLIAHHWMDEAKRRGGDTRQKDDIATISVHNWLQQMQCEKTEGDVI